MALTTRLEFRQSQALVMTPQLMQAIKLLQLSNLDLVAYVEGELEKNPLLERAGDSEALVAPEPQAAQAETAVNGDSRSGDWIGEELEVSRSAIEDRLGTELENVFPEDAAAAAPRPATEAPAAYSEWAGTGGGGREDGDHNLEAFVSAEATLADHLAAQLALATVDPVRRMIGQHLIDLVDEAGYLTGDLGSVAERLGAPMTEVEAVLAVLHGFDPPGGAERVTAEQKGLRRRLYELQKQASDLRLEQEYLRSPLTTATLDTALLMKRQAALNARLDELKNAVTAIGRK